MATLLIPALFVNVSACTDTEFLAVCRAMIWVESRGDPEAVGDGGRSIGPLQISRPYWADACRILGVKWPYEKAKDPVYAITALYHYSRHYCRAAGIEWTPENIARIHNGGPDGWVQVCTEPYWRTVRNEMGRN